MHLIIEVFYSWRRKKTKRRNVKMDRELKGRISIEWEILKCPCCKETIDLKGKKHEFGNIFGENEMFCPKCDEILEIHPETNINFEDNKIYADVVSHRKQIEFRERVLSKENGSGTG